MIWLHHNVSESMQKSQMKHNTSIYKATFFTSVETQIRFFFLPSAVCAKVTMVSPSGI